MFKNYSIAIGFKTAWRNLSNSKFYSLINISGLALGLATGIMLLLWVQHEKSYDKFNKDYQDIYRLSTQFSSNGKTVTWTNTPAPLSVFAQSIPGIKSTVRITGEWNQVISNNDRTKILDGFEIAYVDSSFFTIFNYKLKEGNIKTALPDEHSVMLTQQTANKLFGEGDAIGSLIQFSGESFKVTSILENFPQNSSLQFDAVFPMSFYAKQFTASGGNGDWKTIDTDLGGYNFSIFVKLDPAVNPVKTGKLLSAAYKSARNGESDTQFKLQKLADIHLVGADGNKSAYQLVQIFLLVAILLLAIAGINYVNLSTARALARAREVSIRKIIGATRKQLFFQFVSETTLLFLISTAFAIGIIYFLMPLYNTISGKDLQFSLASLGVWEVIAIAAGATLLASSIYPALLLSSFNPIKALKGKIKMGIGTSIFRKVLVVFQFAISVILIVSTLVISNQMQYIRQKNLGYDKSYVFTVPLPGKVVEHADAVKNELNNKSGILNVSFSNIYNITNITNSTGDIDWKGRPEDYSMVIAQANIDKDYIPTMKMKFAEGGNFTGVPADSAHYIVNEKAVQLMGLKQPYVGQQISFHDRKGTIIGVLKDFNYQSLKDEIAPLIFAFPGYKNILYVRTSAKDAQNAIAAVKAQYRKYAGDAPFSYSFVDKQFESLYKSDTRTGTLFNVFAGIAIFISCLGLLGLATYTTQVRTKEICMRKVLGASVSGIVRMVSSDFLKLIAISIIIAVPVSWYFMNEWLSDFAYRINVGWLVFLIAAMIAIFIALATISFQAIRAALANPVESLKSE